MWKHAGHEGAGGKAARYFDPDEPEQLADEVIAVLRDESLQYKMIRDGLDRAKSMNWEKTAKLTKEVYDAI